jgi:hypothetical protein
MLHRNHLILLATPTTYILVPKTLLPILKKRLMTFNLVLQIIKHHIGPNIREILKLFYMILLKEILEGFKHFFLLLLLIFAIFVAAGFIFIFFGSVFEFPFHVFVFEIYCCEFFKFEKSAFVFLGEDNLNNRPELLKELS